MRNQLDIFYPKWADVPIENKNSIWELFMKECSLEKHKPNMVYHKFMQQNGVKYRKFLLKVNRKQMRVYDYKDVLELLDKPKPTFMKSEKIWMQYVLHWCTPNQQRKSLINAKNRTTIDGCSHRFGRNSVVARLHEMIVIFNERSTIHHHPLVVLRHHIDLPYLSLW